MPAIVDVEKCEGCADCVDACPNGSIAMEGTIAVVNKDDYIDCSACVEACTKHAITMGD